MSAYKFQRRLTLLGLISITGVKHLRALLAKRFQRRPPIFCTFSVEPLVIYNSALYNYWRETQLSLTNLPDAFIGQSRSPNIVPFHILGIVSCCAIVTLSFRRALFTIFDFKKCRDLEIGSEVTQCHWKWQHSTDCLWFPIGSYSNFVPKTHCFWDIQLQNAVTLKPGLGVRQGHSKYPSIEGIRLPIDILYSNYGSIYLYGSIYMVFEIFDL